MITPNGWVIGFLWFWVMGWAGSAWGGPPPRYDHVVVVLEENHGFDFILGPQSVCCPYLKKISVSSADMTGSYAVRHPSLPNYLALFSGSTQGVTDDGCAYAFAGSQLESELIKSGFTFKGYSEGLPESGSMVCNAGGKDGYYKKHVPWAYWQGSGAFPPALSRPFSEFPGGPDYGSLPTVSFVIPNEAHDMHEPNGYPPAGDLWLEKNMEGYRRWALSHNSLFIVTWDEDDFNGDNHIPTLIAGAGVEPGKYPEKINHYDVLRTLEDIFGLGRLGASRKAKAIEDIFKAKPRS